MNAENTATPQAALIGGHRVADPDLVAWLALRRVRVGQVTKTAKTWVHRGHPAPGWMNAALDELVTAGLVALGEPDQGDSLRRARLTDAGAARWAQLCDPDAVLNPRPAEQQGADGGQ